MTVQRKRSRRTAVLVAGGLSVATVFAVGIVPATSAAPAAPCKAEVGVGKTIKVGVIFPKSGPAAPSFSGFDKAVQLRFDQENARGGVYGKKIQTVYYDDMGAGALQTQAANKALQQDGVFGIVVGSSANTMYPILKANNVPVTGLGNQAAYIDNRNVFGATGIVAGTIGANYNMLRAKNGGATAMALINHTTAAAKATTDQMAAQLPSLGMSLALRVSDAPQGAADLTSLALRTKDSGANGVFFNGFVDGGLSMAQAMKQQGYTPKVNMISGLVDPAVVAKTNGLLESLNTVGGTYGTVPMTVNKPSVRTFVNGMKAAGLNPYAPLAGIGFVSADLFIRGLKEGGKCTTRENFISKLRNVSNYDGLGLLPGPLTYKPALYPNGNPPQCAWFAVAKNGTLVPDAKATCGQFFDAATGKVVTYP